MTKKLFLDGAVLRNPGVIDRLCDVNSVFVNSSEYLFHSHPIANAFYLGQEWYDFKENPNMARPLLENLLLSQSRKEYFSGKKEEWKSERAILSAAATIGIQKPKLNKSFLTISHYDFDPRYGYSCALVMQNGIYRLIIRGNPNSVLTACAEIYKEGNSIPMNESLRASLRSQSRHLAGMCERVIAVAVMNLSSPSTGDQRMLCRGMTYLGLFGLSTPISAAAANAVSVCQNSGISTYLLTDDYPETVTALAKSVSIIGQDDYQRALSFEKYERMDRGVFVADIEKYKAYCGFPVEEKQSIVKYQKDNGNITLSLTSGVLDTLPQMESDISVVGSEEKLNSVRLNSDLILKEKRYEIIPLCINWARIFYRNVVHIMQFVLLQQVAFALSLFIGITANQSLPFSATPMLLVGIGACIPSAFNIYHRRPGPYLENNEGVLKDDRIASLRALLLTPFVIGTVQALCVMIARQIAFYATGSSFAASGAALITFVFSAYFTSLSIKFDTPLLENLKEIGTCGAITLITSAFLAYLVSYSPLSQLWLDSEAYSLPGFFPVFFAILFSLLPMLLMEGMKMIKIKDDSATCVIHKNQKGENL
jgi:magnesium-transporting ATPase (P-type)